jgi:signal transduction histidine kinase
LVGENSNPALARLTAEILLDFVKNQRQIRAEASLVVLPEDPTPYEPALTDKALLAVEGLCGKCEESHDDGCFVNQARRTLIAARTGVDLGAAFDGRKSLDALLEEAAQISSAGGGAEPAPEAPGSGEAESVTGAESEEAGEWRRRYEELAVRHAELREQEVFRSTLIDEVVGTITAVTRGDFAAEMPVHEDEQLAKLATAFNLMLRAIHQTMGNLDRLVSERSAEMRMIMDTVPVGLLTVNDQLRIQPEYSKACEAILGVEKLRGRDFFDTLGLTRRRAAERAELEEFLDVVRRGLLDEEQVAFLNPFGELELSAAEGRRPTWVRIQYRVIDRGAGPCHVLVVLKDITESKALQQRVERSERHNTQLKAIAEDPDLYCEFLREARAIVRQAEASVAQIPGADDPRSLVDAVFRGAHTIKGTSGAMGLGALGGLAGTLEDRLSELRSTPSISPEVLEETRAGLDRIREAVEEAVAEAEKLLGQSLDGGRGMVLRVDSREIRRHMEEISALPLVPAHRAEILDRLGDLRKVDVKRGLGRALKIVPGLMERLSKDVEFTVDAAGVRIDCDVSQELNGPLVHLLRNAFDHGIEPAEERELKAKPSRGKVTLTVSSVARGVTVSLADDGRGLDPGALRESARKKGLLTPEEAGRLSDEESRYLIFRPGFSTAEAVTDVSGRGVGMDAVIASVRDALGGEVRVDSAPGRGTTFTIVVPENGPL